MKCVFTATTLVDNADIEILKALLDEGDIACMTRNDQLSAALGEVPHADCLPEIWIMNDEDKPKAQAIVDSWRKAKVKTMSAWVCRCNETIEGQFTSCWKCGRERPER
jgi:putative signal transducing protein